MKPIVLNAPQSRVMRLLRDGITVTLAFGRGVGKSWFVRRIAYLLIAQWEHRERQTLAGTIRGIRVVFLLPSFKQFRDVHARPMLDELRNEFGALNAKVDRTTFTVTFEGGSSIQVFPAAEHSGQRARGIRCDVVILDEADDIDEIVFHEVVTPWFTEPWSLKIKIASGTPKRGRHGLLWRLFENARKGDRIRAGQLDGFTSEELAALREFYAVHATYADAPGNVDQATVQLARVTMPKASFEREYLCSFDAGEGLVYPFDEKFHVIGAEGCPLQQDPEPRAIREFHSGMDHGWVDPGVIIRFGIFGHGEDAILIALEESYESEVPNHVWNERAERWRDSKFWPDPSRPDRVNDLRAMGLEVGDTDNDILAGIARLANLLFIRQSESGERWCRFYVSPRCKNLIREFGLYRRKKLPDGTFDEQPEDRNNHAMDAARYVAVGRFGRLPNVRHTTSGR